MRTTAIIILGTLLTCGTLTSCSDDSPSQNDGSENTDNIIFEGDVTGISTVKTATSIDGNFYDLSGRRVTKPTKGLYFVNGKKVVMK